MRNEALCKLICHNLLCMNKTMDRFAIGAEFVTAAMDAAD